MDWLTDLFRNPFLIASLSSWAVAQILKTIIHYFMYKKLELERLFGDGGMPSGHSATVTALAMMSALVYGTDSFQFAIALILAIIVTHDATGVRLETGKQAVVINELTRMYSILTSRELPETKLKEFVGHTPVQVAAGVLLGILNSLIVYHLLF